jgi:hypothetical protein
MELFKNLLMYANAGTHIWGTGSIMSIPVMHSRSVKKQKKGGRGRWRGRGNNKRKSTQTKA